MSFVSQSLPTNDSFVRGRPEGARYDEQWKALGAWFLGPRAENRDHFMALFKTAFDMHVKMREGYFPTDPPYITKQIRSSDAYRKEMALMKEKLIEVNTQLFNSVPFFSPRYQVRVLRIGGNVQKSTIKTITTSWVQSGAM